MSKATESKPGGKSQPRTTGLESSMSKLSVGNSMYRSFGENKSITVSGIEPKPTDIKIVGNQSIRPPDGQYRMQNDQRFLKPVVINKWVFAVCKPSYEDRDRPNPNRFVRNFMNVARSHGVNVVKPPLVQAIENKDWSNKNFWSTSFISSLDNNKVEFIMIVLPNPKPEWLYQFIKSIELKSAIKMKKDFIRTQCIKYDNYKKGIKSDKVILFSNLSLQVNEKLQLTAPKEKKFASLIQECSVFRN